MNRIATALAALGAIALLAAAIPTAAPITWSRTASGPTVVRSVTTVSACVTLQAGVEYKVWATTEVFINVGAPAVAMASEPFGRWVEFRGFSASSGTVSVCAVTAEGVGTVYFTPMRSLR